MTKLHLRESQYSKYLCPKLIQEVYHLIKQNILLRLLYYLFAISRLGIVGAREIAQVDVALAFHAADMGSVTSIPYSPLTTSRSNSDCTARKKDQHCMLLILKKKIKVWTFSSYH